MPGKVKEIFNRIIKSNSMLFSVLFISVLVLIAIKIVTPSETPVIDSNGNQQTSVPTLAKSTDTVWREMERGLESDLSKFLSSIDGCGRVQVMLRLKKDESKLRAIDTDKLEMFTEETDGTGTTRTIKETRVVEQTVQESYSGGNKTVWLEKQAPEIQGVIVIASGAHDAQIKALLTEAISTYFNIPVYKISVMPGGR